MTACGLVQSELGPCLFVGPKVIAVAYVDDILFFAKDDADIEDREAHGRTSQYWAFA